MADTLVAFDRKSQRTFDENGFLHVALCPISKEVVNPYYGREIPGWKDLNLDPNQIYQGYRAGKELEAGAATFNGLNVLSEHIKDDAEDSPKEYIIGSMGTDGVFEMPYLKNSIIIKDADAIKLLNPQNGETPKKEISASYRYDPVFKPGVFNGQSYDFIMTNIRGNHIALVEEGRAGSDVVVSDEKPGISLTTKRGSKMDGLKIVESLIASLREGGAAPHEGGEEEAKKFMQGGEEKQPEMATDDEVDNAVTELFALIDNIDDTELAAKLKQIGETVRASRAGTEEEAAPPVEDAEEGTPIEAAEEAEEGLEEAVEVEEELEGALPFKKKEKGMAGAPNSGAAPVMDAKLKKLALAMDAALIQRVEKKINAKIQAARECRSLIGDVDPMAFDSATVIYQKALGAIGRPTKVSDPVALSEMVKLACDAKPVQSYYPVLEFLANDSKKKDTNFINLTRIRRI